MIQGFVHLHSLLRWFALLCIIISIFTSLRGMTQNRIFGKEANRWSLLTLIMFHLQLLIGLVLYFAQGWYTQVGNMSDKIVRFFAVEHMAGMVIAIALVTIGRVSIKKVPSYKAKHKRIFWFFLIALIITIASIPWPFREGIARPWFPGM